MLLVLGLTPQVPGVKLLPTSLSTSSVKPIELLEFLELMGGVIFIWHGDVGSSHISQGLVWCPALMGVPKFESVMLLRWHLLCCSQVNLGMPC